MARGILAAIEGDIGSIDRYAFALAVSEGLLAMTETAKSTGRTEAMVKALIEGLSR